MCHYCPACFHSKGLFIYMFFPYVYVFILLFFNPLGLNLSNKCINILIYQRKFGGSSISVLFLFLIFIYLLCIQYPVCVYACRPEEGTRPYYRWLWATMWLLGIELRTFGRADNALNHWAISPAPSVLFFNSYSSRKLFFLFFETGFLCVTDLAVLEITL